MKIPADAKRIVEGAYYRHYPCTLASASPDGSPDIGFKGSMFVFDDESLAYWERSKRVHLKNLQANPKVAVLCWDSEERTGYRFRGSARVVDDPEMKDRVRERIVEGERKLDPESAGYAVIIRVEEILPMGKARETYKPS